MTAMPGKPDLNAFAPIIEVFSGPPRAAFAEAMAKLAPQLDEQEIALVCERGDAALHYSAMLKLNRLLLLELHAARRSGELGDVADAEQFARFVEHAQTPGFIEHVRRRYPPLEARLERSLEQQARAIEHVAACIGAARAALASLIGRPAGRLLDMALGQGDLHAGGQTVARLTFEGGRVMYKPRSLRVDAVLDNFLVAVFGDGPDRVRVPAVIERDGYGWAEFAAHRYCAGEDELRTFYRGLGHWLAVLRLLGGVDIHLENLIAVGPVPVVIDVESLFAASPPVPPTGYGQAYDLAAALIGNSVLRTGIVPYRAPALGFEGVDMSAAGALPDQQPQVRVPTIVDGGTTQARLEMVHVDVPVAQNHPDPHPDVSRYWDEISGGFMQASARLRALDGEGRLEPLLAAFESCRVRNIRRPTMAYVEIGRMLWHPASLHDEAKAVERARDLLARNGEVVPAAPSLPEEIAGEIDDLRYGDVPIFVSTVGRAPVIAALADWRAMRIDLEELTIRSALVATDLNQHLAERTQERSGRRYAAREPRAEQLDARRRKLAKDAMESLLRLAVRGDDGTITWITPEVTRGGWLVRPVQPDLYFGLGGIAVSIAGYAHEAAHGRADAVDGTQAALEGAIRGLHVMASLEKPDTLGGFSGLAAQIWTFTTLNDLGPRDDLLAGALRSAAMLDEIGFDAEPNFDVVDGVAGTIVPLIGLAEATGDARWLDLAARAARRLEAVALVDGRGARWPTAAFDQPIGGFAHGATGVGWSLMRLALAGAGDEADRARWRALADAAFAFQDSLYEEALGTWRDLHLKPDSEQGVPTWCHGSVGIGLAAADLYVRTGAARHRRDLRRAVAGTRGRWGLSHTLCHGDLSLRELLVRAAAIDPQGCAADTDEPAVQIVSAIEEHRGMVGGLLQAAFTPGLMIGLAGAVHSLNRMHPDCALASPLLLERRAG